MLFNFYLMDAEVEVVKRPLGVTILIFVCLFNVAFAFLAFGLSRFNLLGFLIFLLDVFWIFWFVWWL